jgi:glycosyltransferase involved in cell wall biosynthesis
LKERLEIPTARERNPVRIAIFSDCYFPTINGVVTSIKLQVEALRELGHEVDLYCPRYAKPYPDDHSTFRLSAFPFPFHKAEQVTLPWPPSVMRRFWTQPYDVCHLQTPFNLGMMGLCAAWWRGIPRVFHHHTLWEEYVDYLPIPKKATRQASIAVCRWLAMRCQGAISPSQKVKERFAAQGVSIPISVIPTGIRGDDFKGGKPRQELEEGQEVCLYVGRLAHEKSLDVVLRVFANIHEKCPRTRLWLVGDGPARASLEQQAKELGIAGATRFFGFVERTTLKDFVASASLFLFASLTETQGLVLLEAQAGGLPVVAVRASGVDEAVDPEVTGFMVEPGDEPAMVAGALRLLEDPGLHRRFSEAAERWSAEFSIEQMGAALVNTYQRAIETA